MAYNKNARWVQQRRLDRALHALNSVEEHLYNVNESFLHHHLQWKVDAVICSALKHADNLAGRIEKLKQLIG